MDKRCSDCDEKVDVGAKISELVCRSCGRSDEAKFCNQESRPTLAKHAVESDTYLLSALKNKYKTFGAVNTIKPEKGEIDDFKRYQFFVNVIHQFHCSSDKWVEYVSYYFYCISRSLLKIV